ncbi:MAG: ATP-dependent DNA helicase RecG, partial [Lachnospiraceae bacterium]
VRELDNEAVAAFKCIIDASAVLRQTGKFNILIIRGRDENGDIISLKWYNMPFLKSRLKKGMCFIFRGKISKNKLKGKNEGSIILEQPEIYSLNDYDKKLGAMQPIYRLTEGLTNNLVTKSVKQILDAGYKGYEFLPLEVREAYGLMFYDDAIRKIHFPKDAQEMNMARRRLAFNEFFLFIMAMKRFKDRESVINNRYKIKASPKTEEFLNKLPYSLTKAQKKVLHEIREDFLCDRVMNRLIQGDVGSGKTIVALAALLDTAYQGYQGALMAPTEVLAVQHYENIKEMFEQYNVEVEVVLLTGSMTGKEKSNAYEKISSGIAGIIVGTHALIQEKAVYNNLALVITDEQHRFGVRQRETLSRKGMFPHTIVMSATPIPRTLAIILYGDLDISVIDELPKGRLPIKNCVVGRDYRPNAYKFMEKQVMQGRQCYVICPMIEESENLEAVDVISYTDILKENISSDVRIEYLHGKMKAEEKNRIMEDFACNKIQILVSTTVIEVGVNVPNSTVMMVENAERFGLASLHQLRGRVGRGKHQSYCIFVCGSDKAEIKERLDILNKSNDGFEIAAWDLKLRGPGDFFGIRQSGDMDFKIGDIFSDSQTLKEASEAVSYIENNKNKINEVSLQMMENKLEGYMKNHFKLNL